MRDAFLSLNRHLPDAMLLVRGDGAVVAANLAAGKLFNRDSTLLEGQNLAGLCGGDPDAIRRHIRSCLRTSTPLPGALWIGQAAPVRHRCEGAWVIGSEPLLTLRIWRPSAHDRFFLLEQQIEQLNGEVLARRSAQEQASLGLERLLRLQEVTAALSEAITPVQVVEVMIRLGREAMRASGVVVCRLLDDGLVELLGGAGYSEEVLEPWRRFRIDARTPLAESLRTGRWLEVGNSPEECGRFPGSAARIPEGSNASMICIPMAPRGHTLGVVGLSFRPSRPIDPEERPFWSALVSQCAQAFERAYLFEAERSARAEAEAVNDAKDEFLATISHELRTPLTAILGWSRMLASGAVAPEKVSRAVRAIERNAAAQSRLVEDVLDVSRIIAGKLRLEVTTVDLHLILGEILDALRPAAEAKQLSLSARLDSALGEISGDTHRLRQVFSNLLTNAIKFTPAGGRVELEAMRADGRISVEVRDTGEGIAPELLQAIFERFRQADSRPTRRHGGLGLGLAIARHLAELHGGTIVAQSPGANLGSIFRVELPAEGEGERACDTALHALRTSGPTPTLQGIHVLVVEDQPDNLDVVRFALEQAGARVSSASGVREALRAFERERPDVLVSDIGMPELDGFAMIEALRARGERVPSIALTAHVGRQQRQSVLDGGFDQFLAKPADPVELTEAIREVLDLSRNSSSA